jgi:hypothetical protein
MVFMVFYGFLWFFMVFYGFLWFFMVFLILIHFCCQINTIYCNFCEQEIPTIRYLIYVSKCYCQICRNFGIVSLCICNICDGICAHDGNSLNSHTTKRILGGNIEKSILK